jgi:hypothetical protein
VLVVHVQYARMSLAMEIKVSTVMAVLSRKELEGIAHQALIVKSVPQY